MKYNSSLEEMEILEEIEKQLVEKEDLPKESINFLQQFNLNTVAIVHEWLSVCAGSEVVTAALVKIFKSVDVFATVDFMSDEDRSKIVSEQKIKPSFIQKLPKARRHFRYYLPIFPFAVRSHKLKDYPLIISSSHAFAHGLKKRKDQLHISYCHTPMRYIWDLQEVYLDSHGLNIGPLGWASKLLTYMLRKWDARVSKNVDFYIANSNFTARRIRRFYGRNAEVIYPPVNIDKFEVKEDKEDYYITVSRLVCYKKVDLILAAFKTMPKKKLIVIGDGPEKDKIEKMAGSNVTMLSHLQFDKFHEYMRNAKAFVFAGKEDFGITLVEAQSCGTPLIAFNKGGAAEIVKDGKTGLFFKEQSIKAIKDAITRFESYPKNHFSHHEIRENAKRFNHERFEREILSFVGKSIIEKNAKKN